MDKITFTKNEINKLLDELPIDQLCSVKAFLIGLAKHDKEQQEIK